MNGPWEDYGGSTATVESSGPWSDYKAPESKPWEDYKPEGPWTDHAPAPDVAPIAPTPTVAPSSVQPDPYNSTISAPKVPDTIMGRLHSAYGAAREFLSPLIGKTQIETERQKFDMGASDQTDQQFFEEHPEQRLPQLGLLGAASRSDIELPKLTSEDIQNAFPNTPDIVAKMGAGAQRGFAGAANFFLSPLGVATLGIGSLPAAAQRVITATFAVQMGSQVPELATELGKAVGEGDTEKATELAVLAGLNTTFAAMGGKEAVTLKSPVIEHAKDSGLTQSASVVEQMDKGQKPDVVIPETPVLPNAASALIDLKNNSDTIKLAEPPGLINAEDIKKLRETRAIYGSDSPQGQIIDGLIKAYESEVAKLNMENMAKASTPAIQDVPETPIPSLPEQVVTALEEQANRSRQRLSGKSLSPTPQDLYDMAVIGASHLTRLAYEGAKGAVDFAKWSADMIDDVGDHIKPYLETIYDNSKTLLNDADRIQQKGITSEVEKIIQRDEALKPKAEAPPEKPTLDIEEASDHGAELMKSITLEKGKLDANEWSKQMLEKYGDSVRDESVLEDLYGKSKDKMTEGTPGTDVAGRNPSKPGSPRITVSEKTALKEVLKKAEASGEAGRRAAYEELKPKMDQLHDQISESISKTEALNVHLKGQETGSKIGAESRQKDLERADRWLEATGRDIRDSLIKLANDVLPPDQRGRFMNRISEVSGRPSILSPNPDVMFRKAAKLAGEIEYYAGEIQKVRIGKEIEALGERVTTSLGVELGHRQAARSVMDDYKALKSQGSMNTGMLEAIRDKLKAIEEVGRMAQDVKKAAWDGVKKSAIASLADSKAKPMELRPEFIPQPGEKATFSQKFRNRLNAVLNARKFIDNAVLTMDSLFGMLDRSYTGWLVRNMRGPFDDAFNLSGKAFSERTAEAVKLAKGMTEQELDRVGAYAELQQEGGVENLKAQGVTDETIAKISQLTPKEKAYYDAARKAMDETLPLVQEAKRRNDNVEVVPVENYWPRQRDYRVYEQPVEAMANPSTDAIGLAQAVNWEPLEADYNPRNTSKSKQGFTIERRDGALMPVKLRAHETFMQHMQDALYYAHMSSELKMKAEIARTPEFEKAYGKVGQRLILDWIDTVARQGGVDSAQRIKWMDAVRRNLSKGAIAFVPVSGIIHTSNWALSAARLGGWFFKGMKEVATERGQEFIRNNFQESLMRSGSEPGQVEAETAGGKIVKAGFVIPRTLDRLGAQATSLGAYMKSLSDKGLDANQYDTVPLDRTAVQDARILARKSVASPLSKDVPQALSRGNLFGGTPSGKTSGNVSLSRSALHFQNIQLDLWSNLRVDLLELGLKEKNPAMAATTAIGLTAATLLAAGIRYEGQQAKEALTGDHPKKEKGFEDHVLEETLKKVPGMGQIMSMALYGESGIPILDTLAQTTRASWSMMKEKPQAKSLSQKVNQGKASKHNAVKVVKGIAELSGIPGANIGATVLESAIK